MAECVDIIGVNSLLFCTCSNVVILSTFLDQHILLNDAVENHTSYYITEL